MVLLPKYIVAKIAKPVIAPEPQSTVYCLPLFVTVRNLVSFGEEIAVDKIDETSSISIIRNCEKMFAAKPLRPRWCPASTENSIRRNRKREDHSANSSRSAMSCTVCRTVLTVALQLFT